MMIIRQTRDIPTNDKLWGYLTNKKIEFTAMTYYNCGTVYKIYTESQEQLIEIDKITKEIEKC